MKQPRLHGQKCLNNFYLKSQNCAVGKAIRGPRRWVLSADDQRPAEQAGLPILLGLQGVDVMLEKELGIPAARVARSGS